ncbi:MAG: OmpA family protein [bacterium]|nr:OmpA family protein [bacterium]
MKPFRFICFLALAAFLASASPLGAGIGGALKDKVKKKVEKKADEKADEAVDKAAGDGGSSEGTSSESANDVSSGGSGGGGGEGARPGDGVWANYDFIPGDRIIYFEDFTTTGVGDFPQRLDFKEGNMEVVEWKQQRWLRANNSARLEIPLPEVLPQRFTLEFDYYGPGNANTISIFDGTDKQEDNNQVTFFWYLGCGVGRRGNFVASADLPARAKEKIAHCRAMSDGKYLKVYVNDTRVANVPNTSFGRSNSLPVQIWAEEASPLMITNIRIAEGGKKILYDQLMAEGKIVTQGILFASGSDVIKPESTPTLKDIGTMLKDHPDLNVSIEGHTDNVGDDASNLDLSKRRAASVKAFLIEKYGVADAQLQTQGFGESKPISPNDSPEGRQNNRRVELIKL